MTKTKGRKIKKRLKKIGLSQRKLAKHLEVSEQHLCAFLGGYQVNNRIEAYFAVFCVQEAIN